MQMGTSHVNSLRRLSCLVLTGALTLVLPPSLTKAQALGPQPRVIHGKSHPLAQRHVRTVPAAEATGNWHALRRGPHEFSGLIYAMNGAQLTLRLRNGQFVAVNAADAIASGNYSAPLFIGKPVSIDGTQGAGAFTATHIFRVPNLIGLGPDR